GEAARAFLDGLAHLRVHLLDRSLMHEWSDLDIRLKPGADPQGLYPGSECVAECVVNGSLHIDPVRSQAILAGGGELGANGDLDGFLDRRIAEHDQWRMPAEFHDEALHCRCALSSDLPADLCRSGETH